MASVIERRARARRACDRAFAEMVRVIPMRTGTAVLGGVDPSQPPYDTVAIFRNTSALQMLRGRGSGKAENAEARGNRLGLSFALGAVGVPGKPTPLAGWRVQMLEQDGQPSFRFIPSTVSAMGRISFDLVPLGAIE